MVNATPSILVVCTGNLHRSPIAAAYLKKLLGERGLGKWQVASAGTWAAAVAVSDESVKDAQALGLDVKGHVARMVDDRIMSGSDLVVVMERGHKEALNAEFPEYRQRTYMLSELAGGAPFDVPDPIDLPGEHDRVLREMCDLIDQALPRIVAFVQEPGGISE